MWLGRDCFFTLTFSLHTSEGDLKPWLDMSYNGEVGPQHIEDNRYSYTYGNN